MLRPINFPKYKFLELLRKSVGNYKYKMLVEQTYSIEAGVSLQIQTVDNSCYYCNFLGFTITGEIVVNFQGRGFSTLSAKNISNIICI